MAAVATTDDGPATARRPTRPASPRPVWPIGLLGAVAIAAAAEAYVGRRLGEFSSIFSVEWRHNARAIRRHAAGSAVLCFGTSLTRTGMSPRVLEERLGMPAYNFAGSGSQPFACFLNLRNALANGARPKAIVVDYAWMALDQPDSLNELPLVEIGTLADLAEYARAARDASLFGRMALAWLLPSIRGRHEVRANVAAAVDGAEPARNIEWFFYSLNMDANRGACHAGAQGYDGSVDPTHSVLFPANWSCSPTSGRYIDAFLDLAASRGIPVFWVLPPMTPGARPHWASSGTRARYRATVRTVAERHPNVTVLDANDARYPVEAFNDPVHLNRDGAVVLTADVAEAMRARLAARGQAIGWVGLPDYRADPKASRVEDTWDTAARVRRSTLR
jgi:hypothetical protein